MGGSAARPRRSAHWTGAGERDERQLSPLYREATASSGRAATGYLAMTRPRTRLSRSPVELDDRSYRDEARATRCGPCNIVRLVRPNGHASSFLFSIAFALVLTSASLVAAQPRVKGDDLSRARALDKEGAKAYGDGRYGDAIRHFEEAHRLGGPPFELWNVAKCHLRLEQPEQAADMLERYLATPNLPREDREEASMQLGQLKKRSSTLTVSSAPSGAQVAIDGKSVEGRTPLSLSVTPGAHTVTVSSATNAPYTRQVEAHYGRAIIVDATLVGVAREARPPPPDNPYDTTLPPSIALRGAFGMVLPIHGSVGGNAGVGLTALGTYRLMEIAKTSIAAGALLTASGDSWDNRTGQPNAAPNCAPMTDAQSATALSVFAIGSAGFPVAPKVRVVGIVGAGIAGYFVDDVGGDLFVPSCRASPGVRPAILVGAEVDYAITPIVRLSAFPLTWQLQPAFDGTRTAPRDASSAWMRFGIGIGAGLDL